MEINVHIPVRIAVTGEPGPGELAELTRRLTATVAARLARSEPVLARRLGRPPGGAPAEPGEPYDPERVTAGRYALPSYADGGRHTHAPVHGRDTEPWTVLRVARARMPVERFLGYVGEVLGHALPQAVLYESLTGTERQMETWLVRVNKPAVPEELGQELLARGARPERGARTEPAWALTASPESLRLLHAIDPGGPVATAIPALPPGHVLFTFMMLPRIDITDLAALGSGLSFTVPVREAGFCVDSARFEEGTGIPWSRYAEEFGEEPVTVWIQPAVVRPASGAASTPQGVRRDVLFVLLDRHAGGGTQQREPAAQLFVAEGEHFPGLPDPVRRRAEWPAEPGTRVLYARAHLDLAPERLGAAIFRPVARQLADQLLTALKEGREASHAIESLLDQVGPPRTHGRLGTLFTHVLAELERAGQLEAVFDAADATRRFGLRLRLLQQCVLTPYATHPRVQRLRAALAQEREATTAHAYVPGGPGQGEIWLDRSSGRAVKAGHVLAEQDEVYRRRVKAMRPRPGRAEALRAQLLHERDEMVKDVLTGKDQRTYEPQEFAAEAIARAARATGLNDEDFEKIEVEHTIRLLEVVPSEHDGLPSFDVRFEFVSRVVGSESGWRRSAGPLLEPLGEFEARLVNWRLARSGEVFEVVNLVVLGVGAAVVAWEAGIVGILLQLGGGARSVAFGMGLSWTVYVLRTVFGEEEFTAEGFVMAGVEGYLGSVGFRFGGGLGTALAGRFGAGTARARLIGWVTEKLVTGAVGGGVTAGLDLFARDLVDVTLHGGAGSGTREYVRRMEFGAVFGILMSFTVEPALRSAWRRIGPAAVRAALIAQLLGNEGVTAERWALVAAAGRHRMEQTLGQTLDRTEARVWSEAVGERLDEIGEQLAHEVPPAGARKAPPRGARPVPGPPTAPAAPPVARTTAPAPAAAAEAAPVSAEAGPSGAPPTTVPRPGPAARWQSRQQLDAAAAKDAEAGLDKSWYENASDAQLRAREARDPVAREYLDERYGGVRRPYQPDRPGDPALQARLREDLREARAAVEAERRRLEAEGLRAPSEREPAGWERRRTRAGEQDVPPTAKAAAGYEGTVAVARSDIPALAGERFSGGSPRALGSYDPGHEIRPPANVVVPQAHGHAEQDLGQQLDARLSRLTAAEREAARGRTVSIRVDQEVCSICAAGLGGGPRAGVLSGLSARHPEIVFEVTADDTSTVYRLVAGRRVR